MGDSTNISTPPPPLKSGDQPSTESSQSGAVKHRASSKRRTRYTTVSALAEHLGYAACTVRAWLKRGSVIAAQVHHTRHYTDDRKRTTTRGQWRVYEDDVLELLAHMRQGKTIRSFGRGFWRGGKSR